MSEQITPVAWISPDSLDVLAIPQNSLVQVQTRLRATKIEADALPLYDQATVDALTAERDSMRNEKFEALTQVEELQAELARQTELSSTLLRANSELQLEAHQLRTQLEQPAAGAVVPDGYMLIPGDAEWFIRFVKDFDQFKHMSRAWKEAFYNMMLAAAPKAPSE